MFLTAELLLEGCLLVRALDTIEIIKTTIYLKRKSCDIGNVRVSYPGRGVGHFRFTITACAKLRKVF